MRLRGRKFHTRNRFLVEFPVSRNRVWPLLQFSLFKLFLLTIRNLKFQILVINKLIYLRVIFFADYEDFEKILKRLPYSPFSRLEY